MIDLLTRVLLPVFALIALGAALRRTTWVDDKAQVSLGKLLYFIFLPAQLFHACASRDVLSAASPAAVAAVAIACAVGFLVAWLSTASVPAAQRGALVNGAFRGNGMFIGLPVVDLAGALLGPEGRAGLIAAYLVVLAPAVAMFNLGAVVAFRLPRHGLGRAGVARLGQEIWRNPLLIACLAGMALGAWRPGVLTNTTPGHILDLLARPAIPLALLLAGLGLEITSLRQQARWIGWTLASKLLLCPCIAWGLCVAFGAGPWPTFGAVILMSTPVAMASVPMARQLEGDVALSSLLVTVSTILAPIGMLWWLWVLPR